MTFGTVVASVARLDCLHHIPIFIEEKPNMSSRSRTLKRLVVGASIAMAIVFGANAQHSSGNIAGTAAAGDSVVIHGTATGWHRELSIKKDGKFQVRSVPTGEYVVIVTHADGKTEPAKSVAVRVGSTARVN